MIKHEVEPQNCTRGAFLSSDGLAPQDREELHLVDSWPYPDAATQRTQCMGSRIINLRFYAVFILEPPRNKVHCLGNFTSTPCVGRGKGWKEFSRG